MVILPNNKNFFNRKELADMLGVSQPTLRKSIESAVNSRSEINIKKRGLISSGQMIKLLKHLDIEWEYEKKMERE
ncbi:helix-turn-helix domain-containing protein [Reichenbachiella faecimaris]